MNPIVSSLRVIAFAMVLAGTTGLRAAIRTVTNLNDGGAGSLRDTIAAADSEDLIQIAVAGTITLTGGDLVINKSLTIVGPGDPGLLHITRSHAPGTSPRRIFQIFRAGSTLTVRLSGLTFSNGRAVDGGGGAVSAMADLTVLNCVFENNLAMGEGGGAIRHSSGILEIGGCVFRNNFAEDNPANSLANDGGAIVTDSSGADRTFSNCVFSANRADGRGGAIRMLHGANAVTTYTMDACTFDSNQAVSGGAIEVASIGSNATLRISNSKFAGNVATERGGACTVNFLNVSARNSVFSGNTAPAGGGFFNLQSLYLENSTFAGNEATGLVAATGGGGAVFNQGTHNVRSCTFSGNRSQYGGSAIHQGPGSVSSVLRNSIIDHTLGGTSPNLAIAGGSVISLGYNLCSDGGAGILTADTDQINTNPQLDPLGLQFNNGPTETIALLATSPAVDRGTSGGLTTDQRGSPRPWDLMNYSASSGGDSSDIGAYETKDAIQVSPIIVNTPHDHDDGTAGAEDCTLREALKRASLLNSGEVIRFAPGFNGTISLDSGLGPLVIRGSLTLEGPGARTLAISGGGSVRVLQIAATAAAVTISGLTLRDGKAPAPAPGSHAYGGGIVNEGGLTLIDCTLNDNVAAGAHATGAGNSGGVGEGGGIYNNGTLTLRGCTFRDCIAAGGHGTDISGLFSAGGNGGNGAGGAILNAPGGSLTISNCTFSEDRAWGGDAGDGHFGGNGGFGHGAAVFNAGSMTVTAATVVGNTGLSGFAGTGSSPANSGVRGANSGGLATASPALATVRNTLCAGNATTFNVNEDVLGEFISQGYNLIGSTGGSTGFSHATDQTGTDAAPLFANVGPLQNNGGPCDTMLPNWANKGTDKGRSFGLTTDQRGIPRPLDSPATPNAAGGDSSDIGAVETDIPQPGPEFVVNTLDDHDDGSAGILDCTLREAINAATYAFGANTVTFAPGLTGSIMLDQPGTLAVSDSLTIIGPGARLLTISGNNYTRVFSFSAGTSMLSGLTIRNGAAGGMETSGDFMGGGIFNQSTLTVSDCTIANNTATGGDGAFGGPGAATAGPGGGGSGGGIANSAGGSLTVLRCTFSGNSATGGLGGNRVRFGTGGHGGDGRGGAVFNAAGGALTIHNCTLHGNMSTGGPGGGAPQGLGGDGGNGWGAAIFNLGMMSANSLTVTANVWKPGDPGFGFGDESGGQPGSGSGALFSAPGSNSMVRNTVSSSNFPFIFNADVAGTFNSGGFNLIADSSGATGFSAAGDQTFADPKLGPLQNNGGPTDTCALLAGSLALDRGHSGGVTHDQRLQIRPYDDSSLTDSTGGDGSDIGAIELRPLHTGPPEFILIETTAAGLRLCVQGAPFTSYRLHRGELDGLLLTTAAAGTSDALGLVEFTDQGPLPERRFYQVRESP